MSELERWETRFSVPDYVFGTEPNAFLRGQKPLLPARGRALAVADGEGRNGVWLAEQGLDVLSIDFSPKAQAKACSLAQSREVALRTERVDVTTWNWPREEFDVVAATKLKAWLGWQVTYSDRYLSNPLPGLKKNDVLLSTGLRLTFGKAAF